MRVQRAERTKKRITCLVWIGKTRHSGIVLDVSATGLFVQTSARPAPGTPITLELSPFGSREPLVINARVVRKKVVPPQLVTVAKGGLGVRIENAPEAYYAFIEELQREADSAPSDREGEAGEAASPEAARAPAAEERRFRVRMCQLRGSRSRALEITAASEEDARSKAMAALGEDWKILACEPASG